MTSISKIALACAALVAATGAFAQKAGDNIGSIGLAYISPQTEVGPLTSVGPAAGLFNPANRDATGSIAAQTTVSFSLLHMYTDNIGGEVTLGIPPKLTLDFVNQNGLHSGAATVKAWTPTVVAKYFFNTPQDKIRPYVGFGVSHVSFHNITASQEASIQYMAGTDASMSSTWAPVYNAGVIYNIDDKWSINGSVSYLPIKTDVTFIGKGPGAGTTTTNTITLNTTDYVIRLGYRF